MWTVVPDRAALFMQRCGVDGTVLLGIGSRRVGIMVHLVYIDIRKRNRER